mmetsp:Transcript_10688/g.7983  ORF Transcript_10688/g.7983 Transcript_10688/m.7983 type:complete len:81 (-) Transcript_10688:99-341(-)
MLAHDEMEAVFYTLEENFPIIDIEVEFPFYSIMDEDASFNVNESAFVVPVGFEGNGYSFPPMGVDVPQSISAANNKPLYN